MKNKQIASKVYQSTSLVVTITLLILCIVFSWNIEMVLVAMAASLIISAPAFISLKAILWLLRHFRASVGFLWMIMMALIPMLVVAPSILFAHALPGDGVFLFLLGIAASYSGILMNWHPIVELINSNL